MPYSLKFYKKVDSGDLGSFTVIVGLQRIREISLQGRFLEVSKKCSNLAENQT